MTYRCNRFPKQIKTCGGNWTPRWLVTPRLCSRLNVGTVGPVAAAVHPVHPVHPTSTGGGRRKLLILFGKLPYVHPSTPRRVLLIRVRAGAAYLHLGGQGGRMDGLSIHAGSRRPSHVQQASTPLILRSRP